MAKSCPTCAMQNTCPDGENHACAEGGHEGFTTVTAMAEAGAIVRDVNGNVLASRHRGRDQGYESEGLIDPVEAGQRHPER